MTITAAEHRQRIAARQKLAELADLIDTDADDFNVVDELMGAIIAVGLRPEGWRS